MGRSAIFRLSLPALILGAALSSAAHADPDSGKLLATGGVSQIEGAAGGGLVPWAVIAGNETTGGVSASARDTYVPLHDFTLNSPGLAVGIDDRLELSYAREQFGVNNQNLAVGGISKGRTLSEDVFGAKLRIIGDAIYDQDRWLPQIALGVQVKQEHDRDIRRAVGATHDQGTDVYIAGTKLLLDYSLLLDATLRFTKANQFGLLGFGGPGNNSYQPEIEASAALLLSRHLAVGAEFRDKPNNLRQFDNALPIAPEGAGYDLFAAYFMTKTISLTAAYVNLGKIADVSLAPLGLDRGLEPHSQTGFYVSAQISL